MQPFEYDHDGLTLRGQLALPAGPTRDPGIRVMHDGQGVSDFMCAKLCHRAFGFRDVFCVIAPTGSDNNVASTKVLLGCGFRRIGQAPRSAW